MELIFDSKELKYSKESKLVTNYKELELIINSRDLELAINSMSLELTINFLEFGGYPMEFNDGILGDFWGESIAWVDTSYGG